MCRWLFLKDCQKRGLIYDLQRQIEFGLDVDGWHICDYVADYTYRISPPAGKARSLTDKYIVEDFKGVLTDVFRLKSKLFRAIYGFHIRITKTPTQDPCLVGDPVTE